MKVLFVAPYLPSRVRIRPFQWIQALAANGCDIHLVCLAPPEDRWASDEPLRSACQRIDRFALSRVQTLANAARAVATGIPLQALYSRHREAIAHVAALAPRFDVVHIEHLRGVVMADGVTTTPIVVDAVDSISLLFEQAARRAPHLSQRLTARLEVERTRRYEARLPHRFARTLTTSSREREAFIRLAGTEIADRVVTIPNGVDMDYFHPSSEPRPAPTILLTGKMSYHANVAAALRLVHNIMPRVWQARPDAEVVIAGKDPPQDLRALTANPRVTVTGFVDDLRPYFARARVAVAPLVYGAGIQNKVLEAMACGVPVVTTNGVSQAFVARSGVDLFLADTDDDFSRHILAMLGDDRMQQACGLAGRRYVEAHHDWYALAQRLIGVYEDAIRYNRSTSSR
ncbi:MAG: glycosyltransferase [Vicinamibacterales bacterium]